MMDRRTFVAWWKRLEERFGEHPGADAYLGYLDSQGMDDVSFQRAAAAVWATSRFFPRPADFLLVESGAAWEAIRRNVPSLQTRDERQWDQARARIPERAWVTLQALGGPGAYHECRDVTRFRRDFLDAYELIVAEGAMGAIQLNEAGKIVGLLPKGA